MTANFYHVSSGEWVKPKRKYYKMACCDCGLVHKMEFALMDWPPGKGIIFRCWRDEKATKALRKKDRIKIKHGKP